MKQLSTVHRKKDVADCLYNYINIKIKKNIRFLQTFSVILSQCDVVFTHLANDCRHFTLSASWALVKRNNKALTISKSRHW